MSWLGIGLAGRTWPAFFIRLRFCARLLQLKQ